MAQRWYHDSNADSNKIDDEGAILLSRNLPKLLFLSIGTNALTQPTTASPAGEHKPSPATSSTSHISTSVSVEETQPTTASGRRVQCTSPTAYQLLILSGYVAVL